MARGALAIFIALSGCAETPIKTVAPECPPPPPPIYAKDCVRKGDVLNVAEQILKENEQHSAALTELEKWLQALQQDVAKALEASLKSVPASEASVAVIGSKVRVRLSDELLFPSASTQISEGGLRALAHVAEVLRATPSRRIEVNGHTDNHAVRRVGWEDNWQLSTERARKVALQLMKQGVGGNRLLIAGFADTDPVDPGDNDSARAKNRRVELFIEPIAPEAAGAPVKSAPSNGRPPADDEDGPGSLRSK
jgi:chemotaxis protein MotB